MACRADNPAVSCPDRRMAVLRGRFAWRSGHGWVWRDSMRPDWTWDRCPWCWGVLPDLDEHHVAQVRGWMANGYPHDTEDGEGAE